MHYLPKVIEGKLVLSKKASRLKKKRKLKRRGLKSIRKIVYSVYIKSEDWEKRRQRFFSKFGKKCAICKSKYKVGLHHISYIKLGFEPDEDLVALCWSCHLRFHTTNPSRGGNMRANTHQFIDEERQILEMQELVKRI